MQWGDVGLKETVGSIAISVYDIRERLTIYTDQIPKQARWQAEYLVNQTLRNDNMLRSFDNFDRITNSVGDITRIIEQTPDLANRLQYKTMAQLTAERIAVMDAIREERIAAISEIDRQRVATIEYLDTFVGKMLGETEQSAEALIDHFYWRMLQILILIYTVILITFIVLKRVFWPVKKV